MLLAKLLRRLLPLLGPPMPHRGLQLPLLMMPPLLQRLPNRPPREPNRRVMPLRRP